jgi:DNA-binding LacI/PurR family transcriptional regulator
MSLSTRARIIAIAKSLGYAPDPALARAGSSHWRSGTAERPLIAVLFQPSLGARRRWLRGARTQIETTFQRHLHELGFNSRFLVSMSDTDEAIAAKELHALRLSGLITRLWKPVDLGRINPGLPTLAIGTPPAHPVHARLLPDVIGVFHDAVQRALAAGYNHLCVLVFSSTLQTTTPADAMFLIALSGLRAYCQDRGASLEVVPVPGGNGADVLCDRDIPTACDCLLSWLPAARIRFEDQGSLRIGRLPYIELLDAWQRPNAPNDTAYYRHDNEIGVACRLMEGLYRNRNWATSIGSITVHTGWRYVPGNSFPDVIPVATP